MRSGPGSWQAREDGSREVLTALYVRDALGVTDPSGLPRLLGTGLGAAEPPGDEIDWSWMRWWVSIVDPGDAGRLAPPLPEGRWPATLRRHLDDARTWAEVAHLAYTETVLEHGEDRAWALALNDAVAAREAELGRASLPFRLRIEVLPLTTAGIWWIGESAIAVDALLRDDPEAYRRALAPILARLV